MLLYRGTVVQPCLLVQLLVELKVKVAPVAGLQVPSAAFPCVPLGVKMSQVHSLLKPLQYVSP